MVCPITQGDHKQRNVAMNSMPQQARQSKYEREKTESVVSAYYDYRTQLITRNDFLKKVCHRYGPRTEL